MPDRRPTDEQMQAYARAFDFFNARLFGDRLPQPMLGFTSRKMVHGLFISNAWRDRKTGAYVHEIKLNPADLASRTSRQIASTLVHEMCHEDQELNGKPGRKGYHNRQFAQMMLALGLQCTDDGTPEGKQTGTRITHVILDDGPFAKVFEDMPEDLFLPFYANAGSGAKKPKPPRSKFKYTTDTSDVAFWGKPGIYAVCFHTGAPFLREDEPQDQLEVMARDPLALELFQLVAELDPAGRRKLYEMIKSLPSPTDSASGDFDSYQSKQPATITVIGERRCA